MKIALFYHSLLSDWNHGNAHFLRGVATDLVERGHQVRIYEPEDSWSLANLIQEHGSAPIREFHRRYPRLSGARYGDLDLDEALHDVSLAIVHEWSTPALVAAIGRWRARHPKLRLLFHDTHHRAVTAPKEIAAYDLQHYDGVLAYGEVLSEVYRSNDWAARVWTWHEAADTRVFHPVAATERHQDLVWIGNWGDDEREAELSEFLMEPCRELGLRASVHGVRYPKKARAALSAAGIRYEGWIANFKVPAVFSQSRVTVHVPRRPYATKLRGIPTIRPFEALACGIPMVSAPWEDAEGLFTPGTDYLVARSGREMKQHLRDLLHDPDLGQALAAQGLRTIQKRHTCAHRVDELLGIYSELRGGVPCQSAETAIAA